MGYALPNATGFTGPPEALPYDDPIAALRKRLLELQNQKSAYSPQEIEQRRGDNDREYNAGLLLQLSQNQNLQPVGAQVFKRALEQSTPRVTERGTIDPLTGTHTYNPQYLGERAQTQIDALEAKQEAVMEQRRRDKLEKEFRDQQAEANRENQRTLKQMGADTARAVAGGLNANQAATTEDRMYGEYVRDVKDHRTVLTAHKNLNAVASKGDAASDMAFIFQYMKMLDPNSVVREGEFATAQQATGVPDRILNMYNRARAGNFLNAQQRSEMLGAAGRLADTSGKTMDQYTTNYGRRAMSRGLDPNQVTNWAFGDLQERSAPKQPDAQAAPSNVIDVGKAAGVAPPAPQVHSLPRATGNDKAKKNRKVQLDF